eukprot:959289-Rhodomonas_salina.2
MGAAAMRAAAAVGADCGVWSLEEKEAAMGVASLVVGRRALADLTRDRRQHVSAAKSQRATKSAHKEAAVGARRVGGRPPS